MQSGVIADPGSAVKWVETDCVHKQLLPLWAGSAGRACHLNYSEPNGNHEVCWLSGLIVQAASAEWAASRQIWGPWLVVLDILYVHYM